jgi:hypothetical protein
MTFKTFYKKITSLKELLLRKSSFEKLTDSISTKLETSYTVYVWLIGFLVLFLSIIWQVCVLLLNDLPIYIFSISQARIDGAIILTMVGMVSILILLSFYHKAWWIFIFILLCFPLWLLVHSFIDNWLWVFGITILLAIVVPLITYWFIWSDSKPLSPGSLTFMLSMAVLIPILYFLYQFTNSTLIMQYAEYEVGSGTTYPTIDYMNDQWSVIVVDDKKLWMERKIIKTSEIKGIYIK